MKHTPGPWRHEQTPCLNGTANVVLAGENEFMVCECYEEDDEQNDANARLIAAAPELLATLEEYVGPPTDLTDAPCHRGLVPVEKCGRCSRELRARAAIKKAKGD